MWDASEILPSKTVVGVQKEKISWNNLTLESTSSYCSDCERKYKTNFNIQHQQFELELVELHPRKIFLQGEKVQ
jgi:hypothetical protein